MIHWQPYSNEIIVSNFSKENWHNILADISTEKELRGLLHLDYVQVFVAYNENNPIAFALLIEEFWRGNRVQIHGGCWSGSAWDSYAAMIAMVEMLFAKGKAVRSQCTIENIRTAKFLQSLGFVNHYTSVHYRYFWLPYKRFFNSSIYKRLKM